MTYFLLSLLFFQTIPGIPPVLVSGNNAVPIINVANSIWRMSGLLFLVLTIIGIWMSQFKYISEKTGGPGQYVVRCATVGLSLAGYKIIFAIIMWVGALLAFQIFPLQPNATQNTIVPWLPAGSLSQMTSTTVNPTPTPNGNTNSTTLPQPNPTRPPFQINSSTSVMDMIMWGVTNAMGISFTALPALIIIALCNILFVLAIFLITAFWLTFAVILYALGPLMIMAGLIPTYGDKLWGNWIGATIQCSLWQVWMAFCGKLITSSFFMGISQLNPMNRGSSGGGELSGALMDIQQASYALVFLVLYIATPFVANYIFPLGASAGLGAFMMTAATAGANKIARKAAAVKTGGASEVVAQGAKTAAQTGGKATAGAITTGQRAESGVFNGKTSGANNSGGTNGRSGDVNQKSTTNLNSDVSYDGSKRETNYEITPNNQQSVAGGNPETRVETQQVSSGGSAYNGDNYGNGADRSGNQAVSNNGNSSYGNSSNGNSSGTGTNGSSSTNRSSSANGSSSASGSSNSNAGGSGSGDNSQNSDKNEDFQTNTSETLEPLRKEDVERPKQKEKPNYVVSNERPNDVKFGSLPKNPNKPQGGGGGGGSVNFNVSSSSSSNSNEAED